MWMDTLHESHVVDRARLTFEVVNSVLAGVLHSMTPVSEK